MNFRVESARHYQPSNTIFPFTDEAGEKSTLTLDKYVADNLPRYVINGDVHTWIQTQYNGILAGEVCCERFVIGSNKRKRAFSRRFVGDIIRAVAADLVFSDIQDSDL